ncbi:ExbD/TolR family protein [Aquifex sp.]
MKEDREFSEINVIPLVDIMLVLLTIVLTTATFVVQGEIPVNLPEAKSAQQRKTVNPVRIAITKEGSFYLNGKEVHLKDLEAELSKLSKNTPIEVIADKDVKVEKLVEVLDILNKHQLKNVSLLVKKS